MDETMTEKQSAFFTGRFCAFNRTFLWKKTGKSFENIDKSFAFVYNV